MDPTFHAPTRYDFDKGRTRFPFEEWDSPKWKMDVIASQTNQLLRFGRIDQRRTLDIRAQDLVSRYKRLTGTRKLDDQNDIGISVLDAMRLWRNAGWKLRDNDYKISVYGEIEPNEHDLMRTAIYIFRGVHIGLWLPKVVKQITATGNVWDYDGQQTEMWKPGSLGGVLAYCKAYDSNSYEILLWGRKLIVSNRFVDHYSDECWIASEGLDYWGKSVLDMDSLVMRYPWILEASREEG
jgi:hypothetical protein